MEELLTGRRRHEKIWKEDCGISAGGGSGSDCGVSGFCSQQCLSDGKYQCTIGPDSFFCKVLDSFDTISNTRHLDNNVRIECGKLFPFADHPFIIRCYYFRTYVSIDNLTYFNVMFTLILRTFNAFFRHQRRIGSHSVKYSEVIRLLNLLQIGCVNKKLHEIVLLLHFASHRYRIATCFYPGIILYLYYIADHAHVKQISALFCHILWLYVQNTAL